MKWSIEYLEAADAELEALPPSLRARLARLVDMAQTLGLENIRPPHVRQVEGEIWELRAKSADGIARAFYVTATGRRAIIVHAFAKKSEKTPRSALTLAKARAKELLK